MMLFIVKLGFANNFKDKNKPLCNSNVFPINLLYCKRYRNQFHGRKYESAIVSWMKTLKNRN